MSKVFDTAAFRISLVKLHQVRAVQARYRQEVDKYDPDHVVESLELHLVTLENRR